MRRWRLRLCARHSTSVSELALLILVNLTDCLIGPTAVEPFPADHRLRVTGKIPDRGRLWRNSHFRQPRGGFSASIWATGPCFLAALHSSVWWLGWSSRPIVPCSTFQLPLRRTWGTGHRRVGPGEREPEARQRRLRLRLLQRHQGAAGEGLDVTCVRQMSPQMRLVSLLAGGIHHQHEMVALIGHHEVVENAPGRIGEQRDR
jgi:hypothetical protein